MLIVTLFLEKIDTQLLDFGKEGKFGVEKLWAFMMVCCLVFTPWEKIADNYFLYRGTIEEEPSSENRIPNYMDEFETIKRYCSTDSNVLILLTGEPPEGDELFEIPYFRYLLAPICTSELAITEGTPDSLGWYVIENEFTDLIIVSYDAGDEFALDVKGQTLYSSVLYSISVENDAVVYTRGGSER